MGNNDAYERLVACGIKPSQQRLEILKYLMTHFTHPTVEEVYNGLSRRLPTLSLTTVYNTLRMFAERGVAQMLTIDDHRVCYDGQTQPHVHFFCRRCGKVLDLPSAAPPQVEKDEEVDGCLIDEAQIYYKGLCADCRKEEGSQDDTSH